MIEIATISSKGQLVIPRSIREEMKIEQKEKFVVINEGNDNILLKRIRQEDIVKEMREIMNYASRKFKEAGITHKDVEKEIKAVRRLKRR